MTDLPRMVRIEQRFDPGVPVDVRSALARELSVLTGALRPGARIAVGVGSRGIAQLAVIVSGVIDALRAQGAVPFVCPAMGSHGGATPEGQCEVLASYGITSQAMGAEIRPSLATRVIGTTADGVEVPCSVEALSADGILLINRIKPHTDFSGPLGSGLLKMSVIGLGKAAGAAAMHQAAVRLGYEHAIRSMAHEVLAHAPVLGGLAVIENQFHQIARLVGVPGAQLEAVEGGLLAEARSLMPLLPFDDIDLLIIDRIGKNISGAGLDPNVTGRSVHGYSSTLVPRDRPRPFVRRLFVRDLTPETHGNAIGIGLADITTTRLVRAMDARITAINALTALTPHCAKVPIQVDSDREAITGMLATLALPAHQGARIVRIADTLSLARLEVSEALLPDCRAHGRLGILGDPRPMAFDEAGNIAQSR
jgi:hypothetical protein